jgi:hypothetical protein
LPKLEHLLFVIGSTNAGHCAETWFIQREWHSYFIGFRGINGVIPWIFHLLDRRLFLWLNDEFLPYENDEFSMVNPTFTGSNKKVQETVNISKPLVVPSGVITGWKVSVA